MDVQYITASIEVLVIDQVEHLLMQNWAAVQDCVSRLNQRPKKPSFSLPARIRLAYLAGYAARYRQTLIFSAVNNHLVTMLLGNCESEQMFSCIDECPCIPDQFGDFYPRIYTLLIRLN